MNKLNNSIIQKKFSNNDVVRAGISLTNENLADDEISFTKTMEVLTFWRNSHITPLTKAHNLLSRFVHRVDKKAFVAKRLKRFESIKNKLQRFDQMQLKNMQDIGGIRIVVSNLSQLNSVYKILINEHCFYKNEKLIKLDNYIESPKDDGYRSLHIIGKFKNEINEERKIEFQIRTTLQHSWATTLEIIDIFTGQNLKSDLGFLRYKNFFKDVSNQFHIMENLEGFKQDDREIFLKEYLNLILKSYTLTRQCIDITELLNSKHGIRTFEQQLKWYCTAANTINNQSLLNDKKNGLILIRLNTQNHKIEHEFFKSSEYDLASLRYSEYEQLLSHDNKWIIALLSTDAVGGLKEAYPNYFADSETFLHYISFIKMAAELSKFNKYRKNSALPT